jgi:hypothetical protein
MIQKQEKLSYPALGSLVSSLTCVFSCSPLQFSVQETLLLPEAIQNLQDISRKFSHFAAHSAVVIYHTERCGNRTSLSTGFKIQLCIREFQG